MRTLEINTIVTLNNWSLVKADYNESNRFQYNQHLIARTGYYYLAVEITKQGIELINLVGLNATKYGRVQTLSSANEVQTSPKLYKTVNGNEDKFRLNIDVPGQRIKEELVIAKTIYKVKIFATQIITTNGLWSSINETKTEKRGGKRPNSGPKKKDRSELIRISFVIHKSLVSKAKELIKQLKKEEKSTRTKYIYLEINDVIQKGDEFLNSKWIESHSVGQKVISGFIYRRKITKYNFKGIK